MSARYVDVDLAMTGTLITLLGNGGIEIADLPGERADILRDLITERNSRLPKCPKCNGEGKYDHDRGPNRKPWDSDRWVEYPCDQCDERGVIYPDTTAGTTETRNEP